MIDESTDIQTGTTVLKEETMGVFEKSYEKIYSVDEMLAFHVRDKMFKSFAVNYDDFQNRDKLMKLIKDLKLTSPLIVKTFGIPY